MQLVEAGKLELDTPVQRYIPWFRVADPDASARITVRHLIVDIVLLILSSAVLWRLLRLRRWDVAHGQGQPRIAWMRQVGVPLLLEWGLPLALFGGVWPWLLSDALGARWVDMLRYEPDVSWWLTGICALLLLTGAIRVWLALRARRRTVDQRSVATSPSSG